MINRARLRERGSGIVELAVCFPVLASLLFGIMIASMLLFSYHFISEAAREGSRYASVRGTTCTGLSNCPASSSNMQTYLRGLGYPSINSNSLLVTTTWPDGSHTTGSRVSVQVQYPFSLNVPFVPSATINMSSTSVMVISR